MRAHPMSVPVHLPATGAPEMQILPAIAPATSPQATTVTVPDAETHEEMPLTPTPKPAPTVQTTTRTITTTITIQAIVPAHPAIHLGVAPEADSAEAHLRAACVEAAEAVDGIKHYKSHLKNSTIYEKEINLYISLRSTIRSIRTNSSRCFSVIAFRPSRNCPLHVDGRSFHSSRWRSVIS